MEETSHNNGLPSSDDPSISKRKSQVACQSDISSESNCAHEPQNHEEQKNTVPYQNRAFQNFHSFQSSDTSNTEETSQSKNISHSISSSHVELSSNHREDSDSRYRNNSRDCALTRPVPSNRSDSQTRETFHNKKTAHSCISKRSPVFGLELNLLISSSDVKLSGHFSEQWNTAVLKFLYLLKLCMIGIQNYYSSSCQNLILKKLSVPKCHFKHLAAFNRNCFVYVITTGPKDIQLNGRNYDSNPERLQTFLDWPPNHPVSAINLAQNGFVYLGRSQQDSAAEDNENDDDDDEVICPFCFEIQSGWSLEDNPQEVHGTSCPFQLNSSAGGTYLDVFQSSTPLLSNHFRRGRNSGSIRSIRAPVRHRRSLRRDNNLAQHRQTQMLQQPPQPDNLPAQHSQLQRWRQPPQPDNTHNPLRRYWAFIFHLSSTRRVTTWYWTSESCLFRSADSIERLVCAIPRWNYSSLDYSTRGQQSSIWQYQISILDFSARCTTTHHGINLMEGGFINYVQSFWNYSRIVLYAVNFWIQGLFNHSDSGSHSLRLSRCLSYASLAIQLSRSTPRPFFTLLQTSSSTEMVINQPRQHYPSYFIGGRIRRPMIRKILLLRCDGVVFLMSTDSTRNIYRNN